MKNSLFLETYTSLEDYKQSLMAKISLESFIAYYIYTFCSPHEIELFFVYNSLEEDYPAIELSDKYIQFMAKDEIPWQVVSCLHPVIFCDDTIITGLCAVSRHICKYRSLEKCKEEHSDGLLGFRKSCLQAPNEVSIWTKFCEVDIIKTVLQLLSASQIDEVPKNLIRFENHLNKPVRIHNVFKIARDLRKENIKNVKSQVQMETNKEALHKERIPKHRRWKSSNSKDDIDETELKLQGLNLNHQFSEGPFLTLADLVLLPSYYIIVKLFGENYFKSYFPLTYNWFLNLNSIHKIKKLKFLTKCLPEACFDVSNLITPATADVSLYKSDPKRHNPKKRMFTKPEDIEKALGGLREGMEMDISINDHKNSVNWSLIPDGANPFAGHLPDERTIRKSQQLENLTLVVLAMANDDDVIVDFCSGSGHLGILIAYLLPKTTVILLENKEQSILRARERVHKMGLKNVYFFQCNLDFFVGKFDIGVALHACGIASDLVLDKCLRAKAKFVICPCCYGSLHATDRLIYPRSSKFQPLKIEQYLCIGHTADQTHKDHPLTIRGARCMSIIDSDRGRLAEEFGYHVTLSKLNPVTCTDKNNLLIGVPS